MAFTGKLPDYSRMKATLSQTKWQTSNQPAHQTVLNLIDAVKNFQDFTQQQFIGLNGQVTDIGTALAQIISAIANILAQLPVIDGGNAGANAADIGGTPVSFTSSFSTVDSLVATPVFLTPAMVTLTGVSTSGFSIFMFDDAGSRISGNFYWLAIGS